MTNETSLNDPAVENAQIDENAQIEQRKMKLAKLRESGNAFPNDFKPSMLAKDLHELYGNESQDSLATKAVSSTLAGRMMTKRIMGKASFIHLQDMSGQMQIYLRQNDLPEGCYETFKNFDLGDIVGVEGVVFKTKTNELSLHATSIKLLTKSLRPLPSKFHGLTDLEARYRQRYLDLVSNEQTRLVFLMRTQIIDIIRQFLKNRRFMEVETPMMQVLAGGAAARPFITQHNALDMQLYLRIAPELYLKRLVVGGFDRVFEINRNFRNEGLSTRHNPEFTMLEFYQAYADYHDLMNMTEELMRLLAQEVLNTTTIHYQGDDYDFAKPFMRLTIKDAILHYNPDIQVADLNSYDHARQLCQKLGLAIKENDGLGKLQVAIFEKTTEHLLMGPTFITEFPAEVSPLARCNNDNPFVTDRFEFFIGGREIANGFSELNDPMDQAERFRQQMTEKVAGDEEAMPYDEDYIIALEHGLPPTAGEGIGIDRLVMFFTNSSSIKDVILFPHLRPIR